MFICYGISNGPFYGPLFDIWEADLRWLWHADVGCGLFVKEKGDLVLHAPEFDPTQSTAVKIKLNRRGSNETLVEFWVNSLHMLGKPELVWGEWRE